MIAKSNVLSMPLERTAFSALSSLSSAVLLLQELLTAALAERDQNRADFIRAAEQATDAQVRVLELETELSRMGTHG